LVLHREHSVWQPLLRRTEGKAHGNDQAQCYVRLIRICALHKRWDNTNGEREQVRTILSQNTTDTNSSRAFAGLKAAFPEWEAVRTASEGAVEESVRCGGLADIKVARIKVREVRRSTTGIC